MLECVFSKNRCVLSAVFFGRAHFRISVTIDTRWREERAAHTRYSGSNRNNPVIEGHAGDKPSLNIINERTT